MNFRHLQALVAVSDTGSFQAAAERINLTQSAISMQMKALEADLGLPLFDRTTRPPVLTQQGRTAVEQARAVLRELDRLQAIGRAGEGLGGTLRLGVIPSVTTRFLPDAMARLSRDHPNLQLRIEEGLSEPLMDRVAIGDLDAAVITEPASLDAGLMLLTIADETMVLVSAKSHGSKSLSPDAEATLLRERPFIRFNRHAGIGRIVTGALQDRGIRVRDAIELDSIEAILMMVDRGLGVALVPEEAVDRTRWPDLVLRPFGDPPLTRRVGLLVRQRMGATPLVETVHRMLEDAAGVRG